MNAEFLILATFRSAHWRHARNHLCLILAAGLLSSCSQKTNQTLFEGNLSQEAVAKITEKLKTPVRVLRIEIQPDTLTIQVQDPAAPTRVDEYTYRKMPGLIALLWPAVTGPKPVRLNLINPNLEENLFDLGTVNFAAVAGAVREAERRVALDGGGSARNIQIQRRIGILPPSSGDIEWNISVEGPRESASAYADAQGRIRRLNLDGTLRAKSLDYTKDPKALAEAVAQIRDLFGTEAVFNHFSVSRLNVSFAVRESKDSNETHGYTCNLNGVRHGLEDSLNIKLPKIMATKREFFSIDDADWSRVPAMCKTALGRINLPHPNILSIELEKPPPTLRERPLRWRAQVIEGVMGEYGFVEFDPKSGQVTHVQVPDSQVKPVDFLDPAKTPELLANIKEDFGPAARFQEITIDRDRASVKGTAPAHPEEARQYEYDAARRADPGIANSIKNPMNEKLGPQDFFGAGEFQVYETRLSELEQKTLTRLRLNDGKIQRLTFFRQSPFYPGNKKLLLEIRCQGTGDDGRIVYEPAGTEFDLVGGNPSGPVRTTGPQMKSGIFTSENGRFTFPDSNKSSDKQAEALFKQWTAVMDADAAAEEKCNATRWGQLAEKGPVSPADISKEDSREYRLAERGRIETAKKCLAFLERPQTKSLMPQLMTTSERHGLDQRKFFDLDFWRATIRRMTASNDLKKLSEEHWEEFRRDGYPKEGPDLKPWQQQYLRLEADEKIAREERQRIRAKYEGG
ncbi:MAG TPA: hypothetical protein VGH00_03625 [Chthoniobacterales bacterium]